MITKHLTAINLAAAVCLALASPAQSVELFNNGPIITHPGGMANGADRSAISPGGTIYGFGASNSTGFRMADDFSNAMPWNVDSLSFYTYQTGATTSTITDLNFKIWNGTPGASSVVYDSIVGPPPAIFATSLTNIYRTTGADNVNTTRRIQQVDMSGLNLALPAGTYWVDWGIGGSLASGPWQPPVSDPNVMVTGNGMQYDPTPATWGPAMDGTFQQALPFSVHGSIVPEPALFGMLFVSGAALLGLRRR